MVQWLLSKRHRAWVLVCERGRGQACCQADWSRWSATGALLYIDRQDSRAFTWIHAHSAPVLQSSLKRRLLVRTFSLGVSFLACVQGIAEEVEERKTFVQPNDYFVECDQSQRKRSNDHQWFRLQEQSRVNKQHCMLVQRIVEPTGVLGMREPTRIEQLITISISITVRKLRCRFVFIACCAQICRETLFLGYLKWVARFGSFWKNS